MTIMTAVRRTSTDVLTTVSATSNVVSVSATALADLANVGALHARHYRDTTAKELELARQDLFALSEKRANLRVARAALELEHELDADEKLAAKYEEVKQARISATTSQPALAAE